MQFSRRSAPIKPPRAKHAKLATKQKECAYQGADKRYLRGGSIVELALQEEFARVSYPPFIPHREWGPWMRILRLLSTADRQQQFYETESGTQSVFGQWALRVNAAIKCEDSVRIVGDASVSFAACSSTVTSHRGLSCASVCVTFVIFTDCESCTRPISIYPASMEAGEYGLTSRVGPRRRPAVDFVVCSGCAGISFCFVFPFFFSSNAHGLLQV